LWLALFTTFVSAIAGAILGRTPGRVNYDIVGVFVFAFFLGVGGGLTRDLLLGNLPPLALRTPWYIVTVAAAVLLVLTVGRWISRDSWGFVFLDALSLGLYAVIAAQMALDFGLPAIGAILVGFLAAISGGVIVSILRGETPEILQPSTPYALLAVIGVTVFVLTVPYLGGLAAILCLVIVVVLRFVTLNWNISTKSVRPISGAGTKPKQTRRKGGRPVRKP